MKYINIFNRTHIVIINMKDSAYVRYPTMDIKSKMTPGIKFVLWLYMHL